MVGRERELAELGTFFAGACGGEGAVVLLAGEAGVGKTRLAEAATADSRLACLRTVAPARGSSPYAPIAAVLRQYVRREPDGLSRANPLVAHLGALLPELGPPPTATDRETLHAAVRHAFDAIAARGPVVVFLDDLHWADAATLELLPSLAEAADDRPLLLLGAYRTEEIPRGHALRRLRTDLRRAGRFVELTIEPLGAAAAAELAGEALGAKAGPALGAALFDRTLGVPFFVEELAAALRAAGRLRPGPRGLELDDASSVPIPETLRDALRIRTESLSEEARASREAAAAVGLEVDLGVLASLGRDAGIGEALESRPPRRTRAGRRRVPARPSTGGGVRRHALAAPPCPAP